MILTEGQPDGVKKAEVNVDLLVLLGAGGAVGAGASGLRPRALPPHAAFPGITLHSLEGASLGRQKGHAGLREGLGVTWYRFRATCPLF